MIEDFDTMHCEECGEHWISEEGEKKDRCPACGSDNVEVCTDPLCAMREDDLVAVSNYPRTLTETVGDKGKKEIRQQLLVRSESKGADGSRKVNAIRGIPTRDGWILLHSGYKVEDDGSQDARISMWITPPDKNGFRYLKLDTKKGFDTLEFPAYKEKYPGGWTSINNYDEVFSMLEDYVRDNELTPDFWKGAKTFAQGFATSDYKRKIGSGSGSESVSKKTSGKSIPELILGLDDLRQKGLISDEVFEEKKAELLSRL